MLLELNRWRWSCGKVLIVSFEDSEEEIFEQVSKWLSEKFLCVPNIIKEQKYDFTIDPFTRTFINKIGNHLYLTAKEFDLFYFLYSHKGQVFTKEQLYENVWGYDYSSDAMNLTSFIRKLRKKKEPNPDNSQYIITVWG